MTERYFQYLQTTIGEITLIANDNAISGVYFGRVEINAEARQNIALKHAAQQLEAYFSGQLKNFDLELEPQGTDFQKLAWQELSRIPYGKTISYQQQAGNIGDVRKARAVGAANGKNPLAIIIPCHRVIGKNGKLTGFAGGLDVKQKLLELERGFCA